MSNDNNKSNDTKIISFRVTRENYGEILGECSLRKFNLSEYMHLLLRNYKHLEADHRALVTEINRSNCDCFAIKHLKVFAANQGWKIVR